MKRRGFLKRVLGIGVALGVKPEIALSAMPVRAELPVKLIVSNVPVLWIGAAPPSLSFYMEAHARRSQEIIDAMFIDALNTSKGEP